MLVRERLTGLAPPAAAKPLVDLWRPLIEDRAGDNLDRLERLVDDQRRFGDAIHDLLDNLDMGEDRSRERRRRGRGQRRAAQQEGQEGEDGENKESDEAERMRAEEAESSSEDQPDEAAEGDEASTSDLMDDTEGEDGDEAAQPWRPRGGQNEPRGPGLPAVHHPLR